MVLTGDIHSNWVNEVAADSSHARRPVVAAEFVATSIGPGGDGSAVLPANAKAALAENPHVQWHNRQRGYLSCTINENQWTANGNGFDADLADPAEWGSGVGCRRPTRQTSKFSC